MTTQRKTLHSSLSKNHLALDTSHNRLPPLHQSWTLIEPTTRSNDPPRTAIYINNRKLPQASFEHIPISHGDITAVSIAPNPPQIKPTLIINIYKIGRASCRE